MKNNILKFFCLFIALFLISAESKGTSTSPKYRAVKIKEFAKVARVRIKLKFTQFGKVLTRTRTGKLNIEFKKSLPHTYTLRAKLNRKNHFYFNGWHVETQPVSWKKESKEYAVRISLYKLYGKFGDIEENIGSFVTKGRLIKEGTGRIYNLLASSSAEFKDRNNNPVLNITAGFGSESSIKTIANAGPRIKKEKSQQSKN